MNTTSECGMHCAVDRRPILHVYVFFWFYVTLKWLWCALNLPNCYRGSDASAGSQEALAMCKLYRAPARKTKLYIETNDKYVCIVVSSYPISYCHEAVTVYSGWVSLHAIHIIRQLILQHSAIFPGYSFGPHSCTDYAVPKYSQGVAGWVQWNFSFEFRVTVADFLLD